MSATARGVRVPHAHGGRRCAQSKHSGDCPAREAWLAESASLQSLPVLPWGWGRRLFLPTVGRKDVTVSLQVPLSVGVYPRTPGVPEAPEL